jgi:hypothetical protein
MKLMSALRFFLAIETRRRIRLMTLLNSMKRISQLYLGLHATLFVLLFAVPTQAQDHVIDIPIFQPTTGGNERWHLMDRQGKDHLIDLVIDLVPSTDPLDPPGTMVPISARKKAELVRDEINKVFKKTVATLAAGSTEIQLTEDVQGMSTAHDGTHERHKALITRDAGGSEKAVAEAIIDYHLFDGTILAGFDHLGNESQFQSSFGFGGVIADASFSYGELSGNTVDDLLTDTYSALLADLPIEFASNLSLDLLSDEITFLLPNWQSSVFVDNFTSDNNAFASIGISSSIVSIPSTLSLLGISLIVMGFARKKRVKINVSSKVILTKV